MEAVRTPDAIAEFLAEVGGDHDSSGYGSGSGYGYGYGDGSGSGYGSGYGSGSGDGYGYGSGSGDGDGYGYGSGSGYGSGYGYGSGDGSGYGYGYGSGDGSGYGYGYGSGDGSGYGDGIRSFCGEAVHQIDGIPTILRRLRGNIAKGAILNSDFSTTPCFVVKQNGLYAHGQTLREAMSALTDKLFDGMSEDHRIQAFLAAHQWGKEYPNQDLYAWHHRLTGSCDMGRRAFAMDHGIDVEHGSMTVEEFIRLTRDAYGSATIRKLEAAYKEERS